MQHFSPRFSSTVARTLIAGVAVLGTASGASRAAGLTAEQKAALILRPEMYDVMHGKTDRICLNGWWKLKREVNVLRREGGKVVLPRERSECPAADPGLQRGYNKPGYDASGWEEIPVPWRSWNVPPLEGKSGRMPFAGIAYYRTTFRIPQDRKGKRVFLRFDSVQTECWVWINGKLAGTHKNHTGSAGKPWRFQQRLWLEHFEFDITGLVRPDDPNVLVLRVFDNGQPIMYDRFPDDGGIAGPVYLEFRRDIHLAEILVAPDVRASTVELDLNTMNYAAGPRKARLAAEFSPFRSKHYSPPVGGGTTRSALGTVDLPRGESRHRFTVRLADPVLWDVRRPFLYHLRILADGEVIGQTRFGFREFEVVGTRFHLNGHPIYLRGLNPGDAIGSGLHSFNHANRLRYGLKLMREMNVQFIRVHTGPETQIYYDICDEVGIISQDDYSPEYRDIRPEERRDELIQEADVGRLLSKDARLRPEARRLLRRWVVWLHNHPSVCMLTGGNELGYGGRGRDPKKARQIAAYLNGFYSFVKEHDLQRRPVTPTSGLAVWQWDLPVKADYHDYHHYASWRVGWPDAVRRNWEWRNHFKRIYGSVEKPVINGECVGWVTRSTGRRDIRALRTNGDIDKSRYVRWANEVSGASSTVKSHWDWIARLFVRFAGIRAAADTEGRSRATAQMTANVVRLFRRDMDFIEGFALHDVKPAHFGLAAGGMDCTEQDVRAMYDRAHEHVEFKSHRRALAPQSVTLDMYDRHQFGGGRLETNLYVLNNLYRSRGENLVVRLSLENARGAVVHSQEIAFRNVPEHARLRKEITIPLSRSLASGDYTIRARLVRKGTPVNEQALPLFVLARSEMLPKIRTAKRIALYEQAEGDAPAGRILKGLSVRHATLSDFAKLQGYDVLVIGPNSLDEQLELHADTVRSWLTRGGRVVCFEQKRQGAIPFLRELRYERGQLFGGDRYFADLIETKHPVLTGLRRAEAASAAQAGLAPWHWELWNGKRRRADGTWHVDTKGIYHGLILPMTDGVIVAGSTGHKYGKKSPFFGMIACEAEVGRGLVFLSQARATDRYDTDSVARRYIHNLLRYTLGKGWTKRFAPPQRGSRR